MNSSAFDDWYNGLVGFHINSERMLDDFKHDIGGGYAVDPTKLRKWMIVCWNNAIESALDEVYDTGPRSLEKSRDRIYKLEQAS